MPSSEDHQTHDAETRANIVETIKKHDCFIAMFSPTDYLPGFIYSIGLYQTFGQPELICFGMDQNVMASIVNHARDLMKGGEVLSTGKLYNGFLEGYPIQFIEVNKDFYPNYVGYGGWYYDSSFDFPLYQVIWPDKQTRWPWDEEFNPNWKRKQPLLDRSTDFKFYEERNLGVYTTRQAYEGDPILYVYHDTDGEWQFHTSMEPLSADAKLVCLEHLTQLDPSLNEIYHLDYGWWAWRSSKDDPWEWGEQASGPGV